MLLHKLQQKQEQFKNLQNALLQDLQRTCYLTSHLAARLFTSQQLLF